MFERYMEEVERLKKAFVRESLEAVLEGEEESDAIAVGDDEGILT